MPSGCRVYVGNIPKDTREKDLERFFKNYGHLRDVLVKPGYGFVEFEDPRDADDAVYEMNGEKLLGERVSVEIARGTRREGDRGGSSRRAPWLDKYGPPTRTEYRVVVENLSTRVSWQDLKDLMRRVGDVTFADAHKDRQNEGVVEFLTRKDMERAIDKYDGHEINGRKIKLVEEKTARRRRSYSRSRSNSRSKSRSRSRSGGRRSRADEKRKESSRSRSRSGGKRKASRSRSRSGDDRKKKTAKSLSRSRSRSRSGGNKKVKAESQSRSRSDSRGKTNGGGRSRSRSGRSRSPE